jgi:hypothetical protein
LGIFKNISGIFGFSLALWEIVAEFNLPGSTEKIEIIEVVSFLMMFEDF